MNRKGLLILGIVLLVLMVGAAAILFLVAGRDASPSVSPGDSTAAPSSLSMLDDFMCISVTIGADPKTDKNFCWQTLGEIPQGVLQYAPAEAGLSSFSGLSAAQFETLAYETVEAVTEFQKLQLPEDGQYDYKIPALAEQDGYVHRVYLTGLSAGQAYYYRVGDGNGTWSSVGLFKTAPEDPGSFSFLYVTDTQGFTAANFAVWGQLIQNAAERHPDFEFILHLGDAVEEGKNQYQWCMFFGAAGDLLRNRTMVDVAGNKDKQHTFKHYTNGAEDDRKALVSGYYSFDYGDVHFSVLYTGDGDKDLPKTQLAWLENDLAAAEGKKKIVLLHKAPYSDANHADDEEIIAIRNQVMPLCDRYGVQIVLQGHDHYFFRSEPVYDGQAAAYTYETENIGGDDTKMIRVKQSATIYFMNGSAGVKQHSGAIGSGARIYTDTSFLTSAPSYSYCSVDAEKIVFKTYYTDGRLVDSWGLYW